MKTVKAHNQQMTGSYEFLPDKISPKSRQDGEMEKPRKKKYPVKTEKKTLCDCLKSELEYCGDSVKGEEMYRCKKHMTWKVFPPEKG